MKTLKPIPPEVKRRRRMKKYLRRIFWLSLAAAGYFFLLPNLAPSYAPTVEKNRQAILQLAGTAQTQAVQILGVATQIGVKLSGGKEQLAKEGPEALVKQTVDDLKDRVKAIPKEQLKKVKSQFCADVIEEAILACEATESTKAD